MVTKTRKFKTPWTPYPPLLISQTATAAYMEPPSDAGAASFEDAIAEALKWDYTVQLAHNFALQDELYFDVIFNEEWPKMGQPAPTSGLLLEHFFIALPDEPEMMRLSGRNQSGGPPSQWPVVTVQGQVWNSQSGPSADGALSKDQEWWEVTHCFENVDDPLTFFGQMTLSWRNLDFRQKQTAKLSLFVKQNVKIVADGETKDSIYQTPIIRFGEPVIPLIHRYQTLPLVPGASLAQTLQQIFNVIAPIGHAPYCHLRVALQYEYQVAGAGFSATIPVLMAYDVAIGPQLVPKLAFEVAQETARWYQSTAPPTQGAVLDLDLTLFGTVKDQELPLVRIQRIAILEVPKDPKWWNGPV